MDKSPLEVMQGVLLELGWDKFDEQEQNVEDWNLNWRTTSFQMTEHVNVKPWQLLNLHPGTTKITRKDNLAKHLQNMRRAYGMVVYEFIPLRFAMPSDCTKFTAQYFKEKQTLGTKHPCWMCKPAGLSQRRGIIISSDTKDLIFDDTYIVQKSICNPFLVGRYKCDFRLYVRVTGFKPLIIYVYQEGLVWLATEKFDLYNLQNYYAHLTNSNINKSGASYGKIREVADGGCTWTLSRFSYLCSWDVDHLLLWQKINGVVLAMASSVPFTVNCFELFAFGISIDDNLKQRLLEVNCSPALSLDCSADVSVKRTLIHDTTALMDPRGLRNARGEGSKVTSTNAAVFSTEGDKRGLHGTPRPLPYEALLPFASGTYSGGDSAMEKAVTMCPPHTRTSQLRELANRQKVLLLATRETPKAKPKLRGRHAPRRAFTPYLSPAQSRPCKTKVSPHVPSDPGKEPDPHAGDFVLIFPFNEATLGASRNGLNIKRIIQELQKLMNMQHSQVAENKTKRRWHGYLKTEDP